LFRNHHKGHRIWANIEDEGDGPFIEMLGDEPWSDKNPGTAYVLADWQPIETAPKDGSMLLLVVTSTACHALGHGTTTAFWTLVARCSLTISTSQSCGDHCHSRPHNKDPIGR